MSDASGSATAPPAAPSLWRHREFLKLWAGQTISVFGDQITLLALPLAAVLALDASAAEMGLLTAAGWTPHLVLSIVAGVWVDRRHRRKSVLVAADVARAVALATVPLAWALDVLTIEHLYAVAFVVGAVTVFFDVAYAVLFPLIVPRAAIVDAQSKLSVTRSGSYIGGPAIAGFLVQVLTAPVALVADAISFLASAFILRRIDVDEPVPAEPKRESIRETLAGGFRFVAQHPVLRATVACTTTLNFFTFVFFALFVLYMTRALGLSAGLVGVVLSAGAVGALAGALVAARIGRRIGIGPAIALGAVLFPAPLALFPAASGPEPLVVALLIAGEFLSSAGVMLFDINNNSLTLLLTPTELRARTMGLNRTVVYGVRPVGALAGGFLGAAIGLRPTLWLAVAGAVLSVGWLLASPVRSLREVAEPPA